MGVIWIDSGRFAASSYSTAAQDYINRVIAADVAAGNSSGLETAVQDAYAAFIDGLIADGLLGTSGGVISQANSVIKAACVLAGAQTVSGCLVPLVGTAPTNNNFVTADYNRKTGLLGNGSNKQLISNRNSNADPQNSCHLAVYASTAATSSASNYPVYIGAGNNTTGTTHIGRLNNNGALFTRNRCVNFASISPGTATGLVGMSRSSSATYVVRASNANTTVTEASQTPINEVVQVFSTQNINYTNARIAFYSIGESITLALLDSRLVTLMSALAAAT